MEDLVQLTISDIQLVLSQFLEAFPPPHFGKVLSGLPQDVLEQCVDAPEIGMILKFHRKVNPQLSLSFYDDVTTDYFRIPLSLESPARFRLLPFDPVSGSTELGHVYRTVADLIAAFPVSARVNTKIVCECDGRLKMLPSGCTVLLKRVMYRNGEKFLECRKEQDPTLFALSMGEFGLGSSWLLFSSIFLGIY